MSTIAKTPCAGEKPSPVTSHSRGSRQVLEAPPGGWPGVLWAPHAGRRATAHVGLSERRRVHAICILACLACMECTRRTTTANINHGGTRAMVRLMGAGWPDGCSRLPGRRQKTINHENWKMSHASHLLFIYLFFSGRILGPHFLECSRFPIAWRRLFINNEEWALQVTHN